MLLTSAHGGNSPAIIHECSVIQTGSSRWRVEMRNESPEIVAGCDRSSSSLPPTGPAPNQHLPSYRSRRSRMFDQQRPGAERPVGSLDGCTVDTAKMGHVRDHQHYLAQHTTQAKITGVRVKIYRPVLVGKARIGASTRHAHGAEKADEQHESHTKGTSLPVKVTNGVTTHSYSFFVF